MSKRAGICLASGIYPPESGGPAKFTATFSKWVKENSNIPVSVVTLTDGESKSEIVDGIYISKTSRNQFFILRFLKTVIELVKTSNSGMPILANGLFLEVFFASLFSNRKYVVKIPGDIVWERAVNNSMTKSGVFEFQTQTLNRKYRLFRYLFTMSLKRSESVIVASTPMEQLCDIWGIEKDKIQKIYNSVSHKQFKPPITPEFNWDVLTVCRLIKLKKVDQIIFACSELGLNLCVVGDGPELESLKQQASALNVDVNFVGNVNSIDLPTYYGNSSIFVLNSEFEAGTPYALIEARACGVVAIATEGTGSQDVIKHMEDGLLIGTMSGMTLKDALTYLVKNKDFMNSARSKSLLKNFKLFDMEKNYLEILKVIRKFSIG